MHGRQDPRHLLLSELKGIDGKKFKYVEGYVIEGKDIISIIEETDIKIKNSIIKGGLDFTKLPILNKLISGVF